MLKSDPTAPDDQCEEDDPYVSVHKHAPTHTQTLRMKEVKFSLILVEYSLLQHKPGIIALSTGEKSALQQTELCVDHQEIYNATPYSVCLQQLQEDPFLF